MPIPKNTWHCSVCDFYVFNTKQQCNKCLTKKPQNNTRFTTSYDPEFDKEIQKYFQQKRLESKTSCSVCMNEGRTFNYEPMRSSHNCWKYS